MLDALVVTSVGGNAILDGLLDYRLPADLSAVNGIQIVGSSNTYETSVTINYLIQITEIQVQ